MSGKRHVPKSKIGVVWCDASSIAIGIVIEIECVVADC